MASIVKRGSSYQVKWREPGGNWKSQTFPKWAQANKHKSKVEAELHAGTYLEAGRGEIKVADWVQQQLDARTDLASSTRTRTQGIIDSHIAPRWASDGLKTVEHGDIQAWVKELLQGLSVRSVKKIVNVLSAAFDAAIRDRRVSFNPCAGIRYPKVAPKGKIFLSAEQVHQLANATFDDRQKLIVYTLAYTGLRWGELAGLRVRDFDPLRRRLNVEQTIVEAGGRVEVKPPKDNEIRSVPMPKFLVEMVAAHVAGQDVDDLIFTSPRGGPLRNRNERGRWFDQAAESIGVPELTPHGLRHTAASMAISAGASVLSVQRMLGHSSATVTLDVYSSLFEDDLDEVAERLDRMHDAAHVPNVFPSGVVRELPN